MQNKIKISHEGCMTESFTSFFLFFLQENFHNRISLIRQWIRITFSSYMEEEKCMFCEFFQIPEETFFYYAVVSYHTHFFNLACPPIIEMRFRYKWSD